MAQMTEDGPGQEKPKRQRRSTRGAMPVEQLTPLQLHDLGLLQRVIAVRKSYEESPSTDEWLLQAIRRAVYSAYLDCVEEGVGDSAKVLLRLEPSDQPKDEE